jgi:hypothetical protein
MGRTKTIVEVPIEHTRCWSCAFLEKTVYEDVSSGRLVNAYKCPKNRLLPERLPEGFAEKCELYKLRLGVKIWNER